MLNIVIPMAGRGSRFRNVGYRQPKPLIPVLGREMIRLVIDNMRPSTPHRFLFLVLQEHLELYGCDATLREAAPGCVIVPVEGVTQGAACTVLLAKEHIDGDNPLMIANSDQWVEADIDAYLASLERRGGDGLIMTMWADDPKWSYVRFDARGEIDAVVEKQVVSNEATVGIYNFRRGGDFVAAAEEMIRRDERVNGEFYVAPAYNHLLRVGKKVLFENVGSEGAGVHGLGTPEDLERFLASPAAARAEQQAAQSRAA